MHKRKTLIALGLLALMGLQQAAIASEADRNRGVARNCRALSMQYNDGDGQSTAHCQMALYNQCLAADLCDRYPEQCPIFKLQIQSACMSLKGLGAGGNCAPCNN